MPWYTGSIWTALTEALGESDMELDARADAVVGKSACLRCNSLAADVNALQGQIRIYETAAKTHQATIDDLRQKLQDQHNEHLRMDRAGVYRQDGFDTGSMGD